MMNKKLLLLLITFFLLMLSCTKEDDTIVEPTDTNCSKKTMDLLLVGKWNIKNSIIEFTSDHKFNDAGKIICSCTSGTWKITNNERDLELSCPPNYTCVDEFKYRSCDTIRIISGLMVRQK